MVNLARHSFLASQGIGWSADDLSSWSLGLGLLRPDLTWSRSPTARDLAIDRYLPARRV
jgi:hypothetical protein